MAAERVTRWGTRFGFYLAAVGSAFGLGNIWRFPYVVAENGGGAFVFLYLALVFLVGMPFLISELILGKVTGAAVIPATSRLSSQEGKGTRRNRLLANSGVFAVILCLLVLSYYAVISGWVLHFLAHFAAATVSPEAFSARQVLSGLLDHGWLQILLTLVHLTLVGFAVMRGFEAGIEAWVSRVMPLFLVLVMALAVRALSMESAREALRFLLYPDFSQLTPAALGRAIGQVCFTLSIGMGTMVTFGSYMNERANASVAGFRVAIFDSIISIVAGLMIFPLVIMSDQVSAGPALLFESVPFLFAKESGGIWFGLAFFLSLYLAALGASISLLETIVGNLRQTTKWSRFSATLIAVVVAVLFAVVPALSTSVLKSNSISGFGVMEAWDGFLINWLLPIAAVLVSQVGVRRIDRELQRGEFEAVPSAAMARLYEHWRFAILYVAPALVLVGLVLQIAYLTGLWTPS